jgi:dienelactone hydrolase
VLFALALAVSIVAPAVAATNVPSTEITSTPATMGLEYQSVTLTTTDGVELAAWYMPGTNRAGVVVMHGAGSTRSDVLDQAAVLARSGYTLVLIDARGHGDSRGTAMDFGWNGDLDIAAGTAFLASRPEVDPDRIGVVGFSMGGEEAIGAAAADPRIRAVVAEGATARQAADKAWLSDVYGWRGWLQEQVENVQDGITDYLTEASPPTVLRSAVAQSPGTRFLLITAGTVEDEAHAAAYIQAGAGERVTVWNVDGADHTGGYDTQPDDWQQRVVEFLDETLR